MSDLILTNPSGLTAAQFEQLADVPPEIEWLANITNVKTRRAYKEDASEFFAFAGLKGSAEIRTVTRAHIIAWRKDLETRALADTSIRRKLSALSSLFDYLCERNAVAGNPVDGVKRPSANGNEGSTPALGDAQARTLLDAPSEKTLKGKRDRAILAVLLYHGLRREEVCRLRVKDLQSRQGVVHFRIKGKRDKIRVVPAHPSAQSLIEDYLALAKHGDDAAGPSSARSKNNRTPEKLNRHLDPASGFRLPEHRAPIMHWRSVSAREVVGCALHLLRATTNALDNEADISQSAGVARPRQRLDHSPLRPAQDAARGQPDIYRRSGVGALPC